MKTDKRRIFIKESLSRLHNHQIERIIEYDGDMVVDSCNYYDDNWCPLGAGLGITKRPTDQLDAIKVIEQIGKDAISPDFHFMTVKGIPGDFYTVDRRSDIMEVCKEILDERGSGTTM